MKVRPGQNARPLPGEGKVKSSPCRHLPILIEGKRTDSVRLLLDAATSNQTLQRGNAVAP